MSGTVSEADAELAAVVDCPGDVLPSVSLRDRRRVEVGLWTSRNRVAKVYDPLTVAATMDFISAVYAGGVNGRGTHGLAGAQFERLAELLDIQ
jgi:hypothetical protein